MISDEEKSRIIGGVVTAVLVEVVGLVAKGAHVWLEKRRSRGPHTDSSRSRTGTTTYDGEEFWRPDDTGIRDTSPKRDRRERDTDSPYGPGRPRQWVKGQTKLPPGTAGEYRIVDKETGSVKYVGESGDLQRRLNQHTRSTSSPATTDKSGLYDPAKHEIYYQVAKPGASTERRREHEKRKISEHKPSWNRDRGGSGRK